VPVTAELRVGLPAVSVRGSLGRSRRRARRGSRRPLVGQHLVPQHVEVPQTAYPTLLCDECEQGRVCPFRRGVRPSRNGGAAFLKTSCIATRIIGFVPIVGIVPAAPQTL
jgi:hypothetical protein